ncbi:hypothetical protein CONPUDRAFT_139462, partial [Coniophora puteana RWD-64-598 SS2]
MNPQIDSSGILYHSINDDTCLPETRDWLPMARSDCSHANTFRSVNFDSATFGVATEENSALDVPTTLTNLIRLVTQSLTPHVFLLESASFATARPCIPNYLDLARFYPLARTAALLVMQRVRGMSEELGTNDTVEESSNDIMNGAEDTRAETASRASDYETAYSFPMSMKSSHSPPPVRYSWEPIDNVDSNSQYSLFAQYHEFPDSIPIACIADQSVMISLLRSAVYQRLAWGVTEPVIGLGFSPGSPMVQVFLAWPSTTWKDGLPLVAIAGDLSEDRIQGTGWFNVTSPMATYELVQYLSRVIEFANHMSCPGQTRWLEWRFDFANYDKMEDITMDKMASVRAWAEEAMPADAGERRLLSTTSSPPAESSINIPTRELHNVGPPPRWTCLDLASGVADIKHSYKTVHRWLWNRITSLRSALPLIDMGTIPSEYASLTRFVWNKSWDQSLGVSDIDGKLSQLSSELLQQKSAY